MVNNLIITAKSHKRERGQASTCTNTDYGFKMEVKSWDNHVAGQVSFRHSESIQGKLWAGRWRWLARWLHFKYWRPVCRADNGDWEWSNVLCIKKSLPVYILPLTMYGLQKRAPYMLSVFMRVVIWTVNWQVYILMLPICNTHQLLYAEEFYGGDLVQSTVSESRKTLRQQCSPSKLLLNVLLCVP